MTIELTEGLSVQVDRVEFSYQSGNWSVVYRIHSPIVEGVWVVHSFDRGSPGSTPGEVVQALADKLKAKLKPQPKAGA